METYTVTPLFTTVRQLDLLQSDRRPRLDGVHGQIPLDGAIGTVPTLRRAPPELIVHGCRPVHVDHQREYDQARRDGDQFERAQRVGEREEYEDDGYGESYGDPVTLRDSLAVEFLVDVT